MGEHIEPRSGPWNRNPETDRDTTSGLRGRSSRRDASSMPWGVTCLRKIRRRGRRVKQDVCQHSLLIRLFVDALPAEDLPSRTPSGATTRATRLPRTCASSRISGELLPFVRLDPHALRDAPFPRAGRLARAGRAPTSDRPDKPNRDCSLSLRETEHAAPCLDPGGQ